MTIACFVLGGKYSRAEKFLWKLSELSSENFFFCLNLQVKKKKSKQTKKQGQQSLIEFPNITELINVNGSTQTQVFCILIKISFLLDHKHLVLLVSYLLLISFLNKGGKNSHTTTQLLWPSNFF